MLSERGSKREAARERFDRLYEVLRERICLLDYEPGEWLREEDLAAEFGISRTPLRRVLVKLEADGLLLSVQGVGTMVTDVSLTGQRQIYELRLQLHLLAGKLSPVRPDAETLQAFKNVHEGSIALWQNPDPRAFEQLNISFFHSLMRLTANEPLKSVLEQMFYQTCRIWVKAIPRLDFTEEVAIFAREIADVRAAVELGDLAAAAHIHHAHISMAYSRLIALEDV